MNQTLTITKASNGFILDGTAMDQPAIFITLVAALNGITEQMGVIATAAVAGTTADDIPKPESTI